jgi:hypothetical protein
MFQAVLDGLAGASGAGLRNSFTVEIFVCPWVTCDGRQSNQLVSVLPADHLALVDCRGFFCGVDRVIA